MRHAGSSARVGVEEQRLLRVRREHAEERRGRRAQPTDDRVLAVCEVLGRARLPAYYFFISAPRISRTTGPRARPIYTNNPTQGTPFLEVSLSILHYVHKIHVLYKKRTSKITY